MEKLSECEEMIMEVIWSLESNPDLNILTKEVKYRFSKEWKIQTTATFVKRLEQKGCIRIYKIGRRSYYQSLVEFEAYKRMKLEKLLERLYNGNKEKLHMAIDEL